AALARPQSDRAGLQQSEGPCAQSGGTYDSAPLAKDRSHCHRFQRTRMQELLSARRLCPNVIGIRSKWVGYNKFTKEEGRAWQDSVMPIRVARFAIDDHTPHCDLYLSPWHCFFLTKR